MNRPFASMLLAAVAAGCAAAAPAPSAPTPAAATPAAATPVPGPTVAFETIGRDYDYTDLDSGDATGVFRTAEAWAAFKRIHPETGGAMPATLPGFDGRAYALVKLGPRMAYEHDVEIVALLDRPDAIHVSWVTWVPAPGSTVSPMVATRAHLVGFAATDRPVVFDAPVERDPQTRQRRP